MATVTAVLSWTPSDATSWDKGRKRNSVNKAKSQSVPSFKKNHSLDFERLADEKAGGLCTESVLDILIFLNFVFLFKKITV